MNEVGRDYQLSPTLQPIESMPKKSWSSTIWIGSKLLLPMDTRASTCWLSSGCRMNFHPLATLSSERLTKLSLTVRAKTSFRSLELVQSLRRQKDRFTLTTFRGLATGMLPGQCVIPLKYSTVCSVEEYTNSTSVLDLVMEDARSLGGKLVPRIA